MRASLLVGILLLAVGGYVLVAGGTFTSKKNILKVGDVKVTADEKKTIPAWIGGVAVIGGIVLIAAGAKKRP